MLLKNKTKQNFDRLKMNRDPIVVIDCHITGLPPPRATWARTGGQRWPENADYDWVARGVFRLKITNVSKINI